MVCENSCCGLLRRGPEPAAAEEALGTDPRDVEINLRKLLQKSEKVPNTNKGGEG